MSLIVFTMINLVGDPVDMLVNPESLPEEIERVRSDFGLDKPIHIQYWKFLKGALSGDLGNSFIFGRPALTLISERFPATLELALCALIIAITIGLPLGVYAGLKPNSFGTRLIMSGSVFGISIPTFWLGYLLILFFSINLNIFPIQGMSNPRYSLEGWEYYIDVFKHLALPLLTMVLTQLAQVVLLVKSRLSEEIQRPYFKTALSKGLKRQSAIFNHALPNAMLPIVTVLGTRFGFLITGSILTETVFAWPGLGRLMIIAIEVRDYPLVLGILFMLSLIILILNLITDLIYTILDPRINFGSYG